MPTDAVLLVVLFLLSQPATDAPIIENIWPAREREVKFPPGPPAQWHMTRLRMRVKHAKGDTQPEVYVDGTPLKLESRKIVEGEGTETSIVLEVDSLPRGPHTLKVKFEKGKGLFSKEVLLEIGFPAPPTITAVYAQGGFPTPIESGKVMLAAGKIRVSVGGVERGDTVIAYLGDKAVSDPKSVADRDPFELTIPWDGTEAKLTARVIRKEAGSPLSAAVQVQSAKDAQPKGVAPPPGKEAEAEECLSPPPFTHLPDVQPIPEARASGERTANGAKPDPLPPDAIERRANDQNPLICYRFHVPAHFPHPKFSDVGEPRPTEGVIIYEGMQFLATADGHYEVRFNASTPPVPVTLRLQLTLIDKEGRWFTLTLPAIAIHPKETATGDLFMMTGYRGNAMQENWQVRHVGFSHLLPANLGNLAEIRRYGTARFGALP